MVFTNSANYNVNVIWIHTVETYNCQWSGDSRVTLLDFPKDKPDLSVNLTLDFIQRMICGLAK